MYQKLIYNANMSKFTSLSVTRTTGLDHSSSFGECVLIIVRVCVRDTVKYWAERNVEVVAWTVNMAVEKNFFQQHLNINYITDSLTEDCEPHY